MSKQKWFRREILKRFMPEDELERFEKAYRESRMVNVGRYSLQRKEKLPF